MKKCKFIGLGESIIDEETFSDGAAIIYLDGCTN
jgi:hypothetical protein